MTQPPRKSGIRLPWSHEGDSDASQDADLPTAAADAPAPTADASADASADTANAPTSAEAGDASGVVAEAAPAEGQAQAEEEDSTDNALLASLITAMREVAERERESSVSNLRQSVDESVETLRSRSAEAAEQLQHRAEGDITAIGDWVKSETDRIAAEGERRVETRRQLLTKQLSDHEQRSGTEIESLYARIQEYERDLATFFAQLHEINDPAAFGNAAKRMPKPPTIASVTQAVPATPAAAPVITPAAAPVITPAAAPAESSAASSSDQPAEEAASDSSAEAPQAEADSADTAADQNDSSAEPTATADADATPAEAEPEAAEAADAATVVPDTHDARLSALGIEKNGESAEETPDEPKATAEGGAPTKAKGKAATAAAPAAAPADAVTSDADTSDESAPPDTLRARLAELDAKIGPDASTEAATATVVAAGSSGEVATAIVVHGLGSFGAITSFKQALERVDGVHGISLSLGPTGEFVYRATHDTNFDLVAAIEQIERGTAQIERQVDGSLRVVVQRGR